MRIRKYLAALVAACLFSYGAVAQVITNVLPPSPEAASMAKFGEFPVSNFTGTPSIEIPFYEVSAGRIKVPVRLKYHSSGIKLEEMPSRVGLGWTLDAGGVVTRSMKGVPDEYYFQALAPDSPEFFGYFRDEPFAHYDPFGYPVSYDVSPDLHFYSFPGYNGKFTHTHATDPVFYNEDNIIIEDPYSTDGLGYNQQMNVGNFTITTPDGLIYKFQDKSASKSRMIDIIPSVVGRTFVFSEDLIYNYTSSWHLSEIEDPITNEKVTFEYHNPGLKILDFNWLPTQFGLDSSHGYASEFGSGVSYPNTFTVNSVEPVLLKKINFDNGYVEFFYNHNREDWVGDVALTEIKVFDNNHQLQKEFKLEYDYAHKPGATSAKDKRLFLESVQEFGNDGISSLPAYAFTYNNINSLPARDSKEQDIWGYFNDNGESTLKPKLYAYTNRGRETVTPLLSGTPQYTLFDTDGADRGANAITSLYGILNKIVYPTGGKTEFEYEPNQFTYHGSNIEGAGLRIKKILNFAAEPDLQPVGVKSFEYVPGTLSGIIPQYAFLVDWSNSFSKTDYEDNTIVFARNQAVLGQSNGGQVGYSKVTVRNLDIQGNDNGKTEYFYRQEADLEQLMVLSSNSGYDALKLTLRTRSYFPFSQFIDKSHRRGLLEKEIIYDDQDNLLLENETTYSEFLGVLSQVPSNFAHTYSRPSAATRGGYGDAIKLYHEIDFDLRVDRLLPTGSKVTKRNSSGSSHTIEKSFVFNEHLLIDMESTLVDSEVNQSNQALWSTHNQVIYKYPFDYSTQDFNGIIQNMLDSHYLTPTIETFQRELTTGSKYANTTLGRKINVFGLDDGLIAIKEFQHYSSSSLSDFKASHYEYTNGKLAEASVETDSPTAFIWGYANTLPVIEAKNASLSDLQSATNWAIANMSGSPQGVTDLEGLLDYIGDVNTSAQKTTWSNFNEKLRESSLLSHSLVNTASYNPIIGITSQTAPNGQVIYYEYDVFGRLKYIKNQDGHLLKANKYAYKVNASTTEN